MGLDKTQVHFKLIHKEVQTAHSDRYHVRVEVNLLK